MAVNIYVSYAEEDEKYWNRLFKLLKPLSRKGEVVLWHDAGVEIGTDLEAERHRYFEQAHIILFLMSTDFFWADNCNEIIMWSKQQRLMRDTIVIPILVRPCDWTDEFGTIAILPRNKKPISEWSNADAGWLDVYNDLKPIIDKIKVKQQQSSNGPSPQSIANQPAVEAKAADVLLCYNKDDRNEVLKIAEQLKANGVRPWFDEWELRPGLPYQRQIEAQIQQVGSAAVFVGSNGIAPWQQMETDALLRQFVDRSCPVIPVLLEDLNTAAPTLPLFLGNMVYVDFRQKDPDPLKRLVWGITGVR